MSGHQQLLRPPREYSSCRRGVAARRRVLNRCCDESSVTLESGVPPQSPPRTGTVSSLTTLAPSVRAPADPEASPSFYGWRIVALAAVMLAMTAPGQTVGVSVFVDPMMAALDLSRSQLSSAYLIGTLAGAFALPFVGRSIDRVGLKLTTTLIAVGFGLVLVGMAGVVGIVTLTLAFAGIRMLGQGSLSLASTTAVAVWFHRHRGLAIGLTSAIGAAAMSLAPLLLSAMIDRFHWRLSWSIAGLAVWAVVLPVARYGLRDAPRSRPDDNQETSGSEDFGGWTRAEALRTQMFWAVTGAVATSGMITTALAFHQISLLGERGLTVAQAAANFLPQTAAAIVGTLAMGALVDRIAPRLLVAGSMACLAAAMLLVQVAAPGALAIAFGVAAGAGAGTIRTLEAAAFPRYFGLGHIGEIRGLVMSISVGATAFGPLLLALGFERYGSYGPPLTMLLFAPALAAAAAVFAPVPDQALRVALDARGER